MCGKYFFSLLYYNCIFIYIYYLRKDNKMEKRKKRFGDRYDGYRIHSLPPMINIVPFIMKTRNDACNFFQGTVEMGRIDNYIHKKRKEDGLTGFGFLHVIVAAYVRTISQKPGLNRFTAGQRIYQHGPVTLSMMVRKSMELNAQESAIKIDFDPACTADEVYNLMNEKVAEAKAEGDTNHFDKTARVLDYIPSLIMRFVVAILSFLDYFGIMPKTIHKASPFHCSVFITNLGSLGIPPIYHHLYNFGTCPVFIAFGAKRSQNELQKDGSIEKHKYVDYDIVCDERIADGQYYASSFKYFDYILRHPDMLDNPPEEVIPDVE